MIALRHLCVLVALSVVATAAAAQGPEPVNAGSRIYQQRLADGRVVLTDRPVDGAQTQRTWEIPREDPEAARQRSERVRLEAEAVAARIQRRLERQQARTDEFELERLRVGLAEARRDAEIARDNARETAILFAPRSLVRANHLRLPRHVLRPPRRSLDGHRLEAS
jgi:hypothetical protein